jgi:hypothetical protein
VGGWGVGDECGLAIPINVSVILTNFALISLSILTSMALWMRHGSADVPTVVLWLCEASFISTNCEQIA